MRWRGRERELREELEAHRAALEAEFRARGLGADEARRQAHVKLGGEEQIRMAARASWRGAGLAAMGRELRCAARGLRRARAYSLAAILTVAIAIVANAVVFSVARADLFEPLGYPHRRLVYIDGQPDPKLPTSRSPLRYAVYRAWRDGNRTLRGLSAFSFTSGVLTGHGDAEQLQGIEATANLWRVLGVQPALGPGFRAADDRPGAEGGNDGIIISNRLWRSRFGARRGVIGTALDLDGKEHAIVGIAPPGFAFPPTTQSDYWLSAAGWFEPGPGGASPPAQGSEWLHLVGRLRSRTTVAAATRDLDRVAARLRGSREYSDWYPDAAVESLRQSALDWLNGALGLLWVAASVVLLITGCNLAGLAIARGLARRAETATRAALGASRGQLARLAFSEVALLVGSGGAMGAAVTMPIVRRIAPLLSLPGFAPIRLGGAAWAYTALLALILAVLSGVPGAALAAACCPRPRPDQAPRGGRVRRWLVAAEVGLAFVLVASGALLLQSWRAQARIHLGVNPRHVLTFALRLPRDYPVARAPAFFSHVAAALRALPGVESASGGYWLPLSGSTNRTVVISIGGRPLKRQQGVQIIQVLPGYFHTLGITLAGRGFRASDAAGAAPVAVVNQEFVRTYMSGMNSIGKTVVVSAGGGNIVRTIVGIAGDLAAPGLPATQMIYFPESQVQVGQSFWFIARTSVPPLTLVPAARAMVQRLDAAVPLDAPATLRRDLGNILGPSRTLAELVSGFACLAAALAALGIFGVAAYSVAARRREFGIRLALGARPHALALGIMGEGLLLAGGGLAVGLAALAGVRSLLSANLYGVSPLNAATLTGTAFLIVAVAAAACLWPARRAAASDPAAILRVE